MKTWKPYKIQHCVDECCVEYGLEVALNDMTVSNQKIWGFCRKTNCAQTERELLWIEGNLEIS